LKIVFIFCCLLLLATGANAQYLRRYLFVGAAPNNGSSNVSASFGILPAPTPLTPVSNSSTNTYPAGGGFEERFSRIVGVGLDLAAILPGGGKVLSNTIGAISPDLYIHLAPKDWLGVNLDVYGVGGYTLLFRDFTANGVNGGAA
jgi:hypothetical protein